LTVVLPVNVTISNPPSFSADGKVPELLDLGWRKCLPGGCIADALLTDEVLRRWKTQTSAEHIAWTDAAGRDLAIGVSFRGLTQALDALGKER
jgi:invasion protein IalB